MGEGSTMTGNPPSITLLLTTEYQKIIIYIGALR